MKPEEAVVSYMRKFRSSTYSEPLTMSEWYSLFPDEEGCADTPHKWPAKFPNAGKPGVYLIYDDKMLIRYVGMTTGDLNRRVGCYFRYVSGHGSGCKINEKMLPPWKARPYYVRTIPLMESLEAHYLERFLIDTLRPPDNRR